MNSLHRRPGTGRCCVDCRARNQRLEQAGHRSPKRTAIKTFEESRSRWIPAVQDGTDSGRCDCVFRQGDMLAAPTRRWRSVRLWSTSRCPRRVQGHPPESELGTRCRASEQPTWASSGPAAPSMVVIPRRSRRRRPESGRHQTEQ